MGELVAILVPFSALGILLLIGAVTSRLRRSRARVGHYLRLSCRRPRTEENEETQESEHLPAAPERQLQPVQTSTEMEHPAVDISFQGWLGSAPPAPVQEIDLPAILHYEMPRDFRRLRYSGNDDDGGGGEIVSVRAGSVGTDESSTSISYHSLRTRSEGASTSTYSPLHITRSHDEASTTSSPTTSRDEASTSYSPVHIRSHHEASTTYALSRFRDEAATLTTTYSSSTMRSRGEASESHSPVYVRSHGEASTSTLRWRSRDEAPTSSPMGSRNEARSTFRSETAQMQVLVQPLPSSSLASQGQSANPRHAPQVPEEITEAEGTRIMSEASTS